MKTLFSILCFMIAHHAWANLLECSTQTLPKATISISEDHKSKIVFLTNTKEKVSCDITLEAYSNLRKTQAPGDIAEFKFGSCPPQLDKALESRLRKEILLRIDFNQQKKTATLDWLADKQGDTCVLKSFQAEALAAYSLQKI